MKKFISFLAVGSMVLSLALVNVALADSTIGVNMSTTGTLTVNKSSATAVQFQDGSGTTLFIFDTGNTRFGINYGGAVNTKFEVGGTASAAYFLSPNAVQFASNTASVAYSRFGISTTNHANYISASNDLLVSGDVEIRGSASFGGTASVSGIFYMNDGRHRPNSNSTTAFRFQNTAGTTDVLAIDTTNTRVGINAGGAVDTTFEAGGAASISGRIDLGSDASVSGRFELTSSAARFGLNAGGFTDTAFEAGGAASVGTNLNVGENATATTSVIFETTSTTQGVCFVIDDTGGTVKYARIVGTAWTINTTDCR